MKSYIPTIGLEIHAELNTRTKMFCDSKNDTEEKRPNVNVCPVCMGHPGTLPVVNKEAVKSVLKMGVSVCGEIADFTEFDRKNYFYPDIPKGYQISQYKFPLIKGGELAGVKLTRVHLEEDTAKSMHESGDSSLVDFNRAGIPLMELVTEPVIHSAEEASRFAKELQLLLQYLEIAEANMEKGEMRVEANISVSAEPKKFGVKVEVKNLNSFRSVERAIAYEIERHKKILEDGGKIIQETRGWDEIKEVTFSQRQKEESHDYRYFPDPDIPKFYLSEIPEFKKEVLQKELPELPWEKRERYLKIISKEQSEFLVNNPLFSRLFEDAINNIEFKSSDKKETIQTLANYICSDIVGLVSKFGGAELKNITPKGLGIIIVKIMTGELSSRGAKDAIFEFFKHGGDPLKIAEKFAQKSDEGELKKIVEKVISDNKNVADDYKNGKETALQFLIGQGMKVTKGSANPEILKKTLKEALKS